MALDSRYKIIQGAGEEEDWSVCFFFAFLRLDDALQGVENRTVLANFQQKSMQTIYPQDRWLPTTPPPCIKAVSLHFATELSFFCLSLVIDLLLFHLATSSFLLLCLTPSLLLFCILLFPSLFSFLPLFLFLPHPLCQRISFSALFASISLMVLFLALLFTPFSPSDSGV